MSIFRKLLGITLVLFLMTLPQFGCEKKADNKPAETPAAAAKGNVFEPHQKSPKDESYKLTPQELQDLTSEASMQKVFLMPHRVAADLIGKDHTVWGKITHGMNVSKENDTSDAAKNIIEAFEEQTVVYRNDTGAYHLRLKPHKGFGFELVWTGKVLYQREREGAWRNEISDGKDEFFLEKATGSLDRFYRNFRGYMTFTKKGTEQLDGRTVAVIDIAFDKKGHETAKELPNTSHTKDKYRLNIKKSQYTIEQERKLMKTVLPVTGTLYVDTKTGVALKGSLKGGYAKKIADKNMATLTMAYEFEWKNIGEKADILAPSGDETLQQKQRTRMNIHNTFKDMPRDLQDKSGVNVEKPLMPPKTETTKQEEKPAKPDTPADNQAGGTP